MGDLVDLDAYRQHRTPVHPRAPRLYVDLADPVSLEVANRVERALPRVRLRVASATSLVEDRSRCCGVERAAAYAVGCGRGNAFLLACLRLAWGGGFDPREPDVLAEAAAAAGLDLDGTLAAVREPRWDSPALATGYLLRRAGVRDLPALQAGPRWLAGAEPVTAFLALTPRRRPGLAQ